MGRMRMKKYINIESDDFFKIQQKDLCKEFKDDNQAYTSCVVSASDFTNDLMRSAGMFGRFEKSVPIMLGKTPMKINLIDILISRAKGNCSKWEIPQAPEEQKEKAKRMVNACIAGVENFNKELNL